MPRQRVQSAIRPLPRPDRRLSAGGGQPNAQHDAADIKAEAMHEADGLTGHDVEAG